MKLFKKEKPAPKPEPTGKEHPDNCQGCAWCIAPGSPRSEGK